MRILQVNNLTKVYHSNKALSNLNFELKKGDVLGFLGPNGSGKSTTLGILMGVTKADGGLFRWFDETVSISDAKKKIGAMIENPYFYPHLSASDNLKIVCDIKGLSYENINAVLDKVRLHTESKPFKHFSLGMKQRLGLASTLLGDPEVLVLDEPTNGLDPRGIVEIRDIIKELAKNGKTIILASHLLSEVQKICNRLLVLQDGIKVYDGSMDEILGEEKLVEVASTDSTSLIACLKEYAGIASYREGEKCIKVTLNDFGNVEDFSSFLQKNKIMITHFNMVNRSLEKQILNVLKRK